MDLQITLPMYLIFYVYVGTATLFAIVLFIGGRKRPQDASGGFEVKLNTGSTPVLREKEENHG